MPATINAKLKLDAGCGAIEVNGQDVSSAVQRVHVTGAAGSLPRVVLELVTFDTEVDGEMVVRIPAETRAALIALGWTPPEDA